MASPQKERGHIPIANEIAEVLARTQLSGYQHRILWALWRKTWGWHKKCDKISITQFQELTRLKRRHVARTLNELIKRRIVTKNGNTFPVSYAFNKDYEQWQTVTKNGDSVTNLGPTITKNGDGIVTKNGDYKRKKINTKERVKLPVTQKLWNEFKRHRTKIKKPMTLYAEKRMAAKLCNYAEQGLDSEAIINETIEKGWQDLKWAAENQKTDDRPLPKSIDEIVKERGF